MRFEPVTIADNDVFVGTRLALNDIQDTAVLAGFSYDTESGRSTSLKSPDFKVCFRPGADTHYLAFALL